MKKYLRNKNFLYLSITLACEFIFSLVLVALLLAFAKHYDENQAVLISIGILLVVAHVATSFFAVKGIIALDKAITVTLPKAYQKATYWNALILGWLFYPVFVAWYSYTHSGFSEQQIHDFTKKYIYKHFSIVSELSEVASKLNDEFKKEQENVSALIKEKHLSTIEGHKYLFDYLFDKKVITDGLLRQVEEKNIEKIIEDAN